MPMAEKHAGRCACGSVRLEFDTDPTFVAVCHGADFKRASVARPQFDGLRG